MGFFEKNKKNKRRSFNPGRTGRISVISGNKKPRVAVGGGKIGNRPLLMKLIFWLLLVSFIYGVVYAVFSSGYLDIRNIEIEGEKMISKDAIREAVAGENGWSRKRLGILPGNNLLFFSPRRTEKRILSDFRILKDVEIKRSFPDTVQVRLEERSISMIAVSSGHSWVIDEDGWVFDETGDNSSYYQEESFPILRDQGNQLASLGDRIAEDDYLGFISRFRKLFVERTGIGLRREMETPMIASGDIRMETDEGWIVYLDSNLGADREMEMLEVVLNNKIDEERKSDLEYIDLRIQNKVFFRFRNQDIGTDESEGEGNGANQPASQEVTSDLPA